MAQLKPFSPTLSPVSTESQFIQQFRKLVQYRAQLKGLPAEIGELERRIQILAQKGDPLSQLQQLYYTRLKKVKEESLSQLKLWLPQLERELYSALPKIEFHPAEARKKEKELLTKIGKLKKRIEEGQIALQKWQLLGNQQRIEEVQQRLKGLQQQLKGVYSSLLNRELVVWGDLLKRGDREIFKLDSNLTQLAQQIGLQKPLEQELGRLEKLRFGEKLLLYQTKKEVELLLEKISTILNYPLIKIGDSSITPIRLLLFLIILLTGYLIGRYYKKGILKAKERYRLSHSTATLLANLGYYTILAVTFLISLKSIGLDLSSLAIVAGALSVGIGFGLQTIISNFISGIILMFERTIKVGDYIQIDENTRGEVVDISMRSTIIRTNDNINLIIPNQSFIQNNVINWTMGDDIVRFRVPFGVAYGTDPDQVEEVVLGALKECDLPYITSHPTLNVEPQVLFLEMADSSLNFELVVWVKGEYARTPRRTTSRFLKMIYNALNRAGISIPFPQQDLHIVDSVPIQVELLTPSTKRGDLPS
jgi:small-conductance mechanosensitive channel